MKRFTATEKWDKEWFCGLSLLHKCLWVYLCDKCDASGVWEPNYRLASFQIGQSVSVSDLEVFGDRITTIQTGKILILGFVSFQYNRLSADCKPHKPIIALVEKHGIERVLKGYQVATKPLQEKDKEKEEDKEKDKEQETEKDKRVRRLNKFFNRRDSTEWSAKERKSFDANVGECPAEDFALVEDFYINSKSPYLRRDLVTLLNNWNGEIDRARAWVADGKKLQNGAYQQNSTNYPRQLTGAQQRQVGIPETKRNDDIYANE